MSYTYMCTMPARGTTTLHTWIGLWKSNPYYTIRQICTNGALWKMRKWGYGNEKVCTNEDIEMKMLMLQWDYVKEKPNHQWVYKLPLGTTCRAFRNVFNIEEREVIQNTFVLANFNYCPIVWLFCDKASICKMEKTQERALRFLLNDKKSSYFTLPEKIRQTTLHLKCITRIACEAYKSLNKLNSGFMTDMVEEINISYDLRDSSGLTQSI